MSRKKERKKEKKKERKKGRKRGRKKETKDCAEVSTIRSLRCTKASQGSRRAEPFFSFLLNREKLIDEWRIFRLILALFTV